MHLIVSLWPMSVSTLQPFARSQTRRVKSSDPVTTVCAFLVTATHPMPFVWPEYVCSHTPLLMFHSLAVLSLEPETTWQLSLKISQHVTASEWFSRVLSCPLFKFQTLSLPSLAELITRLSSSVTYKHVTVPTWPRKTFTQSPFSQFQT